MPKIVKSREVAVLALITFVIFCSQNLLAANANTGSLIGFVYAEDQTTPVEGAVLQARNINSGKIYKSTKTDKLGMFKIEKIDQGFYVAGVSTKEGDFNLPHLVGIKGNETAKASFALKPGVQPEAVGGAGAAGFFGSTAGILVLVAALGLLTIGFVILTQEEAETSPFKK